MVNIRSRVKVEAGRRDTVKKWQTDTSIPVCTWYPSLSAGKRGEAPGYGPHLVTVRLHHAKRCLLSAATAAVLTTAAAAAAAAEPQRCGGLGAGHQQRRGAHRLHFQNEPARQLNDRVVSQRCSVI